MGTWVNPYKKKLEDFPNRLFSFSPNFDSDAESVRALCRTTASVFVELGSGSGGHLIELARQNPDAVVIGIEIRFKRAVRTIEKAHDHGVENCFVLRISYERLLELFLANSISRVYVNFPDPWAKKRQLKHRILGPRLLDALPQLLMSDAMVHVKTDHREYFDTFLTELSADNRYTIECTTHDLHASEYVSTNILTEFEQLFLRQSLPIHYVSFRQS